MPFRRLFAPLLVALGLAAACTAPPRSGDLMNAGACDGCEPSRNAPERPEGAAGRGFTNDRLADNRLCRKDTALCDLDAATYCDPSINNAGAGGASGGPSGVGGAQGGGGAAGSFGAAGGAPSAGSGGAGGEGDAGAGGGERRAGEGDLAAPAAGAGGAGDQKFACRMVRDNDAVLRCDPAGGGGHFASCSSSNDCKPGFSCVLSPLGPSVCLHSCCSPSACDDVENEKTYCTVLSLVEGVQAESNSVPLSIPVCAPAKDCNVLERRGGGACAEGEICKLVDDKGTTTCEKPLGALGYSDDGCPCAEGYVCLEGKACRKLCPLGNDAVCGEGGTCLNGGQAFPVGVGICGPDSTPPR